MRIRVSGIYRNYGIHPNQVRQPFHCAIGAAAEAENDVEHSSGLSAITRSASQGREGSDFKEKASNEAVEVLCPDSHP